MPEHKQKTSIKNLNLNIGLYKNIIFIGNSPKFINIFNKIFNKKIMIEVVPWRANKAEAYLNTTSLKKSPNLIVVCGYDYESSYYEYERFINANVNYPLSLINKLSSSNSKIIFIDTENSNNRNTFSRYRYAKNALAEKFSAYSNNYSRISLPVIVDDYGMADIHGSYLTKLIFNGLIRYGLIETINEEKIIKLIIKSLTERSISNFDKINGKYLKIRRSLFFDRVLRFICG